MNQDDDGYYVSCSKEGCVVMTNSYTEEKAVEVWNTRKPMQEILERLEEDRNYDRPIYEADYFDGLDLAIEIVKEVGGE